MSDTAQGPGWWRASDDKWYPPHTHPGATPVDAPPASGGPSSGWQAGTGASPGLGPAPSNGNGCLKAVAIVGGIFVVLLIAVVVIVGVAANRVRSKVDSGLKNSSDGAHPPLRDLELTGCEAAGPSDNLPRATGTLTNHSSKASHYIITVEFDQGTARVASGSAVQDALAAGSTTTWVATGDTAATAAVTCKVVSVNRFAAQR